MKELTNKELYEVSGGDFVLNNSFLSTLVKGFSISYEVGQGFGSAIRRLFSGNICKI